MLIESNRILLATYLAALVGLFLLPIAGPQFYALGISADKWLHVALFGGLAILLRWNVSTNSHAVYFSIGLAILVAALFEFAQSLANYRSADSLDLMAGLIGAMIGGIGMDRVMRSALFEKVVGLLVVLLGLLVFAIFMVADAIGIGDMKQIGILQIAGMMLGVVLVIGGTVILSQVERD